jgi:alpha-1,3-mannosyltransferase
MCALHLQVIFIGLYLLNLALVLAVYIRTRAVPAWVLGLLVLSKRVHSIFILRLFNDGVAMLLAYAAILVLQVLGFVVLENFVSPSCPAR